MIEERLIRQFADRWQTTADNVVREYFQHLFLSHLYRQKRSEALRFKGGTALRLIWKSPRFSEDLDFTGAAVSIPQIETLMEAALAGVEQEGIDADIEESKATTGGYFAVFRLRGEGYESGLQTEVSLRKGARGRGTAALVQTELLPPYTLVHLEEAALVGEKVQACLTRGKPRDFFDLYFILRNRMAFRETFARDKTLGPRLREAVRRSAPAFRNELKRFLPVSQHLLLKDFPATLNAEISRSLPDIGGLPGKTGRG